jgi:hypothetical protein
MIELRATLVTSHTQTDHDAVTVELEVQYVLFGAAEHSFASCSSLLVVGNGRHAVGHQLSVVVFGQMQR